MVELVNTVFKTRLQSNFIDLLYLADKIPNSQLFTGRPTQLKVTFYNDKIVCLLFGKGAIRIMGKVNLDRAYDILFFILSHFSCPEIPSPVLELQTMTYTANFEQQINLVKFDKDFQVPLKTHASFEIFSALQINAYRPITVNLFSSGKMVICGVKCEQQASDIYTEILVYLCLM